jgi:hypothetical protein
MLSAETTLGRYPVECLCPPPSGKRGSSAAAVQVMRKMRSWKTFGKDRCSAVAPLTRWKIETDRLTGTGGWPATHRICTAIVAFTPRTSLSTARPLLGDIPVRIDFTGDRQDDCVSGEISRVKNSASGNRMVIISDAHGHAMIDSIQLRVVK